MKTIIFKVLAVSLFSMLFAGVFAQPNQQMRMLVTQMNKDLIEMAKAGRFEAMAKYYDENTISLPNYKVMEKGFKLITNNKQGMNKGGYKIVDGEKVTTDLIMGVDMMVDIGTYSLTITFPGLKEPKVDMGKYMNVWKKDRDDNWRIIAETWNADKSPNAPQQGKDAPGSTIKISQGMEEQK